MAEWNEIQRVLNVLNRANEGLIWNLPFTTLNKLCLQVLVHLFVHNSNSARSYCVSLMVDPLDPTCYLSKCYCSSSWKHPTLWTIATGAL